MNFQNIGNVELKLNFSKWKKRDYIKINFVKKVKYLNLSGP